MVGAARRRTVKFGAAIDMGARGDYNTEMKLKMKFKMKEPDINMKLKKILIALAALALFACVGTSAEGRLNVVAVNFPCYDFARQVLGDLGDATLLVHPGVEVHSYEPSPADIIAIGEADLFVYIGGEGDTWVDNILSGFDASEAPATLRMMDAVTPLEEEEHEHDHGHDHAEEGPEYDEHIWTSPKNAAAMVDALAAALQAVDPEHADAYGENAAAYQAQIEAVDGEIEAIVAGAARRELVFADRFPFLYFVRAYGLDYLAAFPSCTADTEPTPQTIMGLIDRVRQDGIPAVYTIELSSQNVARTVAEETGAKILTLHSMQTVTQDEFDAGESYVSLMRGNVEALREGLN